VSYGHERFLPKLGGAFGTPPFLRGGAKIRKTSCASGLQSATRERGRRDFSQMVDELIRLVRNPADREHSGGF
jgi:hypothetical protein